MIIPDIELTLYFATFEKQLERFLLFDRTIFIVRSLKGIS
jgi:hypothetical protein